MAARNALDVESKGSNPFSPTMKGLSVDRLKNFVILCLIGLVIGNYISLIEKQRATCERVNTSREQIVVLQDILGASLENAVADRARAIKHSNNKREIVRIRKAMKAFKAQRVRIHFEKVVDCEERIPYNPLKRSGSFRSTA